MKCDCTFRLSGKQPEIWDPVTGEQRALTQFVSSEGCTSVPLEFTSYGAMFVVFRKGITNPVPMANDPRAENFPGLETVQAIPGPWSVQFDPEWFYPTNDLRGDEAKGLMVFETLADWNTRPELAVKNFSGHAVYNQVFVLDPSVLHQPLYLDLGMVKETARVRLNNQDLGVVWCPPWRVKITGAAKAGRNTLQIQVANSWPNRLVGDKQLPGAQRRTRTRMFVGGLNNIQLPSGLLGPVTIKTVRVPATKSATL